jgi:hypothetical protein
VQRRETTLLDRIGSAVRSGSPGGDVVRFARGLAYGAPVEIMRGANRTTDVDAAGSLIDRVEVLAGGDVWVGHLDGR